MTKQPTPIDIDTDRHVGTPNSLKAALRAGEATDSALVGVAVSQGGLTRNPVYVACENALNADVRSEAVKAARTIGGGGTFEPLRDAPSIQKQCDLPQAPPANGAVRR